MKIELDFSSKTITVKGKVNLLDFLEQLNVLKIDFTDWILEQETVQSPYITYPNSPLTTPRDWTWRPNEVTY